MNEATAHIWHMQNGGTLVIHEGNPEVIFWFKAVRFSSSNSDKRIAFIEVIQAAKDFKEGVVHDRGDKVIRNDF